MYARYRDASLFFMSTEVRDVRPDEWTLLKQIRLRALADAPLAFDSTVERDAAHPDGFWKRLASGRSVRSVTLFGLVDGRVSGLVGGSTYGKEEHPQLVMMWVDPVARGTGLGELLVRSVTEWAESSGYGELRLWVGVENTGAIRLYEKCGFLATGERGPVPTHPQVLELEMRRAFR
jgi:GNAT superfamily N-acetyltransferase